MPYNLTTSFSSLCACLLFFSAAAQSPKAARISGKAEGYAGVELTLYTYKDPISKESDLNASTTIQEDGSFDLTLPVADTCQAWISLRRHTAPVILHPGSTYTLELGIDNEPTLIHTWQRGELSYAFTSLAANDTIGNTPSDPNSAIAAIDAAYFNFFAAHGNLIGTRSIRGKLHEFKTTLMAGLDTSRFEGKYAAFTVAEVQLAAGLTRKEIFDISLKVYPVELSHPGYYALFSTFFDKYFEQYSNRFGGSEFYNKFAEGIHFNTLDSLLLKDDFLQADDLRHAVILYSIGNSAYNARYSRPRLIEVLQQMQSSTLVSEPHKAIAERLVRKIQNSGVGSSIYDLGLRISPDTIVNTLIFVSASWSTTAQREAATLGALADKYSDDFRVIEFQIDQGESVVKLAESKWPVLGTENVAVIMDRLEVYRIPQFIWANRKGEIELLNAPQPSDGLENLLYKIKVQREQSQVIKVGQ